MTIYKHVCSCGEKWFSDYKNETDCSNTDDDNDDAKHMVTTANRFTAIDYVVMWESDLENANRHSSTDMPADILKILNECIPDKKIVKKIMKKLYDQAIGV